MALHDEVVQSGLHVDNSASGALDYIRSILGGEGSHRQEDLKTLAILFAFKVLVPGAIALISYAAHSADVYFAGSDSNPLGEVIPATLATNTDLDTGGVTPVNDPILVEGVQTILGGE